VRENGHEVIRLNLGEPDFNSAEKINEVAIAQINRGNSHYTDPKEFQRLGKALPSGDGDEGGSGSVRTDRCDHRAKPPISYTMMTYVNPGDEVIYPSRGSPFTKSWVTFLGAVPVPLHLEEEKEFRFDAGDLEKLISRRPRCSSSTRRPTQPEGVNAPGSGRYRGSH